MAITLTDDIAAFSIVMQNYSTSEVFSLQEPGPNDSTNEAFPTLDPRIHLTTPKEVTLLRSPWRRPPRLLK